MTARPLILLKLIAAMFFWGGTWIAGRIIAQEVSAPLGTASIRFALAALALALVSHWREGRIQWPETLSLWGTLSGLAFTGIFLYGLCFFFGLKTLTAGRGALVVALNPVVVVLIARLLGQEKLGGRRSLGVIIALLGSLTVLGNGDPLALLQGGIGIGEWLILGCVFSWSAYTFLGRLVALQISALSTTLHACWLGAIFLGLAAFWQGDFHPADWSLVIWGSICFLAFFGTAVAYTWFTEGVHALGAGQASVFINLVPVFAVIQAAWLLDEHLALSVLGGGLLVIAGVWLTTQQKTLVENRP